MCAKRCVNIATNSFPKARIKPFKMIVTAVHFYRNGIKECVTECGVSVTIGAIVPEGKISMDAKNKSYGSSLN